MIILIFGPGKASVDALLAGRLWGRKIARDFSGSQALAQNLLTPAIEKLKDRERRASPQEKSRAAVISAVMNAGCPHQPCLNLADADSIADAVMEAL